MLLRLIGPLLKRDRITLVLALLVVTLASWLFVELADEIMEDEPISFDRKILLAMREPNDANDPVGPVWFEEMARDITALGSTTVLVLLVAGVSIFLLLEKKRRSAAFLALAAATGGLASHTLKSFFERPRPDLVAHKTEVITLSFPSGHSMLSAVVFLTIGTIVAQSRRAPSSKTFVIATAIVLTLLVGCSRTYLGVHWPSDVIAGWSAGSIWAVGWWFAARLVRGRGANTDETS